jgi:hypothetical protein
MSSDLDLERRVCAYGNYICHRGSILRRVTYFVSVFSPIVVSAYEPWENYIVLPQPRERADNGTVVTR